MKKFFRKLSASVKAHKRRTIVIALVSFFTVCVIVTFSCLGAFVFNRFATGYVPTEAQLEAIRGTYKRVVIIGVDGVGTYPEDMLDDDSGSLPNFKRIFVDGTSTKNGVRLNACVTYEGMAVYPTISAQNWASMFHGVRPPYHGITGSNSNRDMEGGKQANSKYPSFVKVCLDANPGWKAISVCTWCAVNEGAIENLDRVQKSNTTCTTLQNIVSGKETLTGLGSEELKDYIKAMTHNDGFADADSSLRDAVTVQKIIGATTGEDAEDYQIVFMHLNQVDSAGHSYGNNKQAYARAVSRVDALIGRLYEAYDQANMADDTLFIFCTDHGHRYAQDGTGHGGNSEVERTVTFAISGKTVKSGKPGKYVNTDLAPIVCYALGVKGSSKWQGRVPYSMFTHLG